MGRNSIRTAPKRSHYHSQLSPRCDFFVGILNCRWVMVAHKFALLASGIMTKFVNSLSWLQMVIARWLPNDKGLSKEERPTFFARHPNWDRLPSPSADRHWMWLIYVFCTPRTLRPSWKGDDAKEKTKPSRQSRSQWFRYASFNARKSIKSSINYEEALAFIFGRVSNEGEKFHLTKKEKLSFVVTSNFIAQQWMRKLLWMVAMERRVWKSRKLVSENCVWSLSLADVCVLNMRNEVYEPKANPPWMTGH